MSTAAIFSDADMRKIRRSFLARKAAPDEIRLVLRRKQRSHIMWVAVFALPLFSALPIWAMWKQIFNYENVRQGLAADFWWACCFLLLLYLLLFCLIPAAYAGRFELILNPGSATIRMRGLGLEQARPAATCAIVNRRLWANFTVDTISYQVLRRWWQLALPIGAAAEAIERTLQPARLALRESLLAGGSRALLMQSSRRTLLAKAFGEAIVTENEIAVLLPPSSFWYILGTVVGFALGSSGAAIWYPYRGFMHAYYVGEMGVNHVIHGLPVWWPAVLVLLIPAVTFYLADPWVRKALAIVPRGLGVLRIQVGGRVRGEYPVTAEHIALADFRHSDTVGSHIYVKTPTWSGTVPTWGRFDEFTMADYSLDAWARGELLPWEDQAT